MYLTFNGKKNKEKAMHLLYDNCVPYYDAAHLSMPLRKRVFPRSKQPGKNSLYITEQDAWSEVAREVLAEHAISYGMISFVNDDECCRMLRS